MLEIKNTVRKMKNTFDGLVSMYGVAEERISKFNDRLIVMERKKRIIIKKKKQNKKEQWENFTRKMHKIGIAKAEERTNWSDNGRKFSEVNDRYQNKENSERSQTTKGLTYRRKMIRIITGFFSNAISTSMYWSI